MSLTLNPNDHIEVTDPDDPRGMPAYGGPIENAHRHLEPGIYTAYAHGDNGEKGRAVLAVTETDSTAQWGEVIVGKRWNHDGHLIPRDLDGDVLVVLPDDMDDVPGAVNKDGLTAIALIDLARHIVAEYGDRDDMIAWSVTYADLDNTAGREVTEDEADTIARAIEHSTVNECVSAAVEQVCGLPDGDDFRPAYCPSCSREVGLLTVPAGRNGMETCWYHDDDGTPMCGLTPWVASPPVGALNAPATYPDRAERTKP